MSARSSITNLPKLQTKTLCKSLSTRLQSLAQLATLHEVCFQLRSLPRHVALAHDVDEHPQLLLRVLLGLHDLAQADFYRLLRQVRAIRGIHAEDAQYEVPLQVRQGNHEHSIARRRCHAQVVLIYVKGAKRVCFARVAESAASHIQATCVQRIS